MTEQNEREAVIQAAENFAKPYPGCATRAIWIAMADFAIEYAKSKWIAVSDRLPKKNIPILIAWKRFHDDRICVDCGFVNSEDKWESEKTDGYNEPIYLEDEGNILGWMPMPVYRN